MPGQVTLALALLALLVGTLTWLWRWFATNRAALISRLTGAWQHAISAPAFVMIRGRYPRAWGFVMSRFARGEYLGLHLTIGLVLSSIGLWLFTAITEDVVHSEPLTQFDITVFEWAQAHAHSAGRVVFTAVSALGSLPAMTALALGLGLVLAQQRRWIVLFGWGAAFVGGGVLDGVFKLVIQRPRPPTAAALMEHSWSFPSGHAMGSLVGYGMLAYLLLTLWIRKPLGRSAVIVAAALVVVAIGFSRLYLGVHYFSDVVGGYAAGVLWLSVCASGLEVALRWKETPHPS